MNPQGNGSKPEKKKLKKKQKHPGWNISEDCGVTLSATQDRSGLRELSPPLQLEDRPEEALIEGGRPLSELSNRYSIELSHPLGQGFASVVYLGREVDSQRPVCAKVVDLAALHSPQQRQLLANEVRHLRAFQHPNIVALYDVFASPTFCYLIMELCEGGDLFRFLLAAQEPLAEELVDSLVLQTCRGLAELQARGLVHRDLKTENLLVAEGLRVKIGDLGFCVSAAEADQLNVGSPIYMAPEAMQSQHYSFAADVYALGVIWYELLHREAPWRARSEPELLLKKLSQEMEFPRTLKPATRELIQLCLHPDPNKRPQLDQIIQHAERPAA